MPTWDQFMNERSAAGTLDDADDIIIQQSGVSKESNLGDLKTFISASLSGIAASTFDANTILKADTDDTPEALTVTEQTIVGRITGGEITALTATQVRTLLNVEDGADVTDATNVASAGAVMETTFPDWVAINLGSPGTAIDTTGAIAGALWFPPWAITVTDVHLYVGSATTTGTLTLDINEAGTSILSTKLTIDATETTSATAAAAAVISDSSIAAHAKVSFDWDGVGDSTATDAIVVIEFTRDVS